MPTPVEIGLTDMQKLTPPPPWPPGSTDLQSEADTTKFRASGKKYEHVKGVPYWSVSFELALTDFNHVRSYFCKHTVICINNIF